MGILSQLHFNKTIKKEKDLKKQSKFRGKKEDSERFRGSSQKAG